MTKTSLFILGAPKCGTTSFVYYLSQHPSIFFPQIKEPHFFCFDFPSYCRVRSITDYQLLYKKSRGRICGDASVWYLYSTEAVEHISKYNPDALCLVLLRDPTEMLPSLHSQLIYSGREDIEKFDDAWDKIQDRKDGISVPANVLAIEHLFYDEVCNYFDQLVNVYHHFDKKQVKIVFFEDLVKNPYNVVCETLKFCGLDFFQKLNYDIKNRRKIHRHPRFSLFLMHPPFPFNIVKFYLKKVFIRKAPLRKFYAWLSIEQPKSVISKEMKVKIRENYVDDVNKLETMTGRDLKKWLN